MFTKSQIFELIAVGENSAVEFKSSKVTADSLSKEIVAFSNHTGGIILLGVEDNGLITGIENDKEEWVMNIARQNVIPPVNVLYYKVDIDDKNIGVIEVPKGLHKPYQTNKFQHLIRVGSTNRVASQPELMRLFQQSGIFHFDSVGVDKTSISDLNLTKIDEYFSMYEIDFSKESEDEKIKLLQNTDILTETQNFTVGGLLIFGINPQRYLYNACISFAHFNGNEIDEELIDKQVVNGTLDMQI
ncbi:MAG: putative DNA binding domain-containing protein, partial [Bacteroidia bacterium]|nr:putative DNA binding domain-containing protein [Bacteroidia bacterium]